VWKANLRELAALVGGIAALAAAVNQTVALSGERETTVGVDLALRACHEKLLEVVLKENNK
jgi:hypothetical protein